jgi:hypothetical protein
MCPFGAPSPGRTAGGSYGTSAEAPPTQHPSPAVFGERSACGTHSAPRQTPAISAARCRTIEHREAEERERSARRQAERVREAVRREREVLERWEYNCRALGGTPVTLYTSEGAVRACRGPHGGLLPVPA